MQLSRATFPCNLQRNSTVNVSQWTFHSERLTVKLNAQKNRLHWKRMIRKHPKWSHRVSNRFERFEFKGIKFKRSEIKRFEFHRSLSKWIHRAARTNRPPPNALNESPATECHSNNRLWFSSNDEQSTQMSYDPTVTRYQHELDNRVILNIGGIRCVYTWGRANKLPILSPKFGFQTHTGPTFGSNFKCFEQIWMSKCLEQVFAPNAFSLPRFRCTQSSKSDSPCNWLNAPLHRTASSHSNCSFDES